LSASLPKESKDMHFLMASVIVPFLGVADVAFDDLHLALLLVFVYSQSPHVFSNIFVLIIMIVLILCTIFPGIITWLPELMIGSSNLPWRVPTIPDRNARRQDAVAIFEEGLRAVNP
jgi:hypothetical protein